MTTKPKLASPRRIFLTEISLVDREAGIFEGHSAAAGVRVRFEGGADTERLVEILLSDLWVNFNGVEIDADDLVTNTDNIDNKETTA